MDHRWEVCPGCGPMIRCGKCGNNCCNGTQGIVDGVPCDACDEAYVLMSAGPPEEFLQSSEYVQWMRWAK